MIHKVSSTILDKKYLALRSIETSPIQTDLSKMVVNKPWGHEYLLTDTPLVEVWHLSLGHHQSTSMHCHPNKKTALIVLDGQALFSTLNGSRELSPMDAVLISSGVFHSTQCISRKALKLLEIETPPMKHDLIRLEDKYGRVNTGYEGVEKMKVTNGAYIRFDNKDKIVKNFCNSHLCISSIHDKTDFKNGKFEKTRLGIILNGLIKSTGRRIAHSVGDVVDIKDLKSGKYNFKNVSLLSISPKK